MRELSLQMTTAIEEQRRQLKNEKIQLQLEKEAYNKDVLFHNRSICGTTQSPQKGI